MNIFYNYSKNKNYTINEKLVAYDDDDGPKSRLKVFTGCKETVGDEGVLVESRRLLCGGGLCGLTDVDVGLSPSSVL